MKNKRCTVRKYSVTEIKAGKHFERAFCIDDFYLMRKDVKDSITFIKEHQKFFNMVCCSPATLINLMNNHQIDSSPLIDLMQDAFFQDEDGQNYSAWMSISAFRRALDFCMIKNDDSYLENYLFQNPAMNMALAYHDHNNDPLLLAWYGRNQKIQKPVNGEDKEAVKPEPRWINNLGFFVSSAVGNVAQAVFFNANEQLENEQTEDFVA